MFLYFYIFQKSKESGLYCLTNKIYDFTKKIQNIKTFLEIYRYIQYFFKKKCQKKLRTLTLLVINVFSIYN